MRRILLLFAPLPTVAASFALATWVRHDPHSVATQNVVAHEPSSGNSQDQVVPPVTPIAPDLHKNCEAAAGKIMSRLGPECSFVVRAPLVLAGDMESDQLVRTYERTIQPAMTAMLKTYFDQAPNEPIVLLLFSHEGTYTHYAGKLFGQKNISIYGYYKPASRTLILNLGTGSGTLVHELTHALIDFDFPDVPIWFNEGLASLHEQCRFVENEGTPIAIEGLANWRLPILQEAIANRTLPSLATLTTNGEFLGANEAVNYAQARYLCMYLQHRGLLETYYDRFKSNRQADPTGKDTLLSLFPGATWGTLDAEFRQWARTLQR